jgi:hypothetical protein
MLNRKEQLTRSIEQAERLEHVILAVRERYAEMPEHGKVLVEPYRTLLASVRAEIDSCLELGAFPTADLVIRVESPQIGKDGAPSQILVDQLVNLRKALASTFVLVSRLPWAGKGRYSQELRGASDVTVLGIAPGSVRIGIDLPTLYHKQTLDPWVAEPGAEPQISPAKEVVNFLMRAAEWAASDGTTEELEREIPDPRVRKTVLAQVRKLSPSPKGGITSVHIEGGLALGHRSVHLTPTAGERAREGEFPGKRTQEFEDSGVLKKLSLDDDKDVRRFELRERPSGKPNIRGDFPGELRHRVLEVMKHHNRVRVRGILEISSGARETSTLHLEDFGLD